MRIGIGIDTGGTYTDAVLYDLDTDTVLCSAKALTTREDLSVGIGQALDGLDQSLCKNASIVALSTTLATNACVENKGGRAKLLLLNVPKKTFDWVGKDYGLPDDGTVVCAGSGGTLDGSVVSEPDWDALLQASKAWLSDAEGLGIVELYAMNNGATIEKKAKEQYQKEYSFPIICGNELFSDLNSLKRGASTLLNARLVPILQDFMHAMHKAFAERGISANAVVVRSDATVMSDSFALLRPVETILCGPAASVLGGTKLTGEENSIIVDMGGTTTDVSLVKEGKPVSETNGVRVGDWQTYVKGVFIDTFALGGDSAIRMVEGKLSLQDRRVMPLCVAAKAWPSIKDSLQNLLENAPLHSKPLHEFFYVVKDIAGDTRYTARERKLVELLQGKALCLKDAAALLGETPTTFHVDRLENEGVLMRAGFTPTDAMHILGDFTSFDTEASVLAAKYFAQALFGKTAKEEDALQLARDVYDAVQQKLFCNLLRILYRDKMPKLQWNAQMQLLAEKAWQEKDSKTFFQLGFGTKASLVGIGAPTHVFLPAVAKALHTKCVIPKYASVANAVGAIMGRISAKVTVKITPDYKAFGVDGYMVQGTEHVHADTLAQAIEIAKKDAMESAHKEALHRGLTGEINVVSEVVTSTAKAKEGQKLDMGTSVIAVATAK